MNELNGIEIKDAQSLRLIAENLMDSFEDKKFDRIEVIYNQFKNAASQILTTEQFLPVEKIEADETESIGSMRLRLLNLYMPFFRLFLLLCCLPTRLVCV